jgi:hypothetical protein
MLNLRCTESTSKCGCGKIHNCDRCPYMTKSPFFMINHTKRNHLPPKSFSCETNDLAKYYCKECDFETDLVIIFNQHVGEYHRKKIDSLQDLPKKDTVVKCYVCQKCSFETYSVLVWIKHLDTLCVNIKEVSKKIGSVSCSDEKWYQCKCCSFKTTQAAGLKKHQRAKYLDANRFQCEECDFETKYKQVLMRHKKKGHLPKDVQWFKCDKCNFMAKDKSYVKTHALVIHAPNKKASFFSL